MEKNIFTFHNSGSVGHIIGQVKVHEKAGGAVPEHLGSTEDGKVIYYLYGGRIENSDVIVIGSKNTLIGHNILAVGDENILVGDGNVAEGQWNTLIGDACISFGSGAIHGLLGQLLPAKAAPSHTRKTPVVVQASFQRVERSGITVMGNGNTIVGDHNKIIGNTNVVQGNFNQVDGNINTVLGDDCKANGKGNTVHGKRAASQPVPAGGAAPATSAAPASFSAAVDDFRPLFEGVPIVVQNHLALH